VLKVVLVHTELRAVAVHREQRVLMVVFVRRRRARVGAECMREQMVVFARRRREHVGAECRKERMVEPERRELKEERRRVEEGKELGVGRGLYET
jgi:hypothetical protein